MSNEEDEINVEIVEQNEMFFDEEIEELDDQEEPLIQDSSIETTISPYINNYSIFKNITRISCVIVFILTVAIVIFFHKSLLSALDKFLIWIQSLGFFGGLLLLFLYIISTVVLFPPFLMTLAGGFIFGYWALIIDLLGASLGSSLAFILGKTMLRSFVVEKLGNYPKFEIIDRAIKNQGWKIVLLIRLCPIIPDNILNYLLSLTKIGLVEFFISTLIGMLPGTCLLVYLGRSASSLKDIFEGKVGVSLKMEIITILISGLIIIGIFIYIIRVSTSILNQIMNEQEIGLKMDEINETTSDGDEDDSVDQFDNGSNV
eukprot:gene8516-340_t